MRLHLRKPGVWAALLLAWGVLLPDGGAARASDTFLVLGGHMYGLEGDHKP